MIIVNLQKCGAQIKLIIKVNIRIQITLLYHIKHELNPITPNKTERKLLFFYSIPNIYIGLVDSHNIN